MVPDQQLIVDVYTKMFLHYILPSAALAELMELAALAPLVVPRSERNPSDRLFGVSAAKQI